MEIVRSFEQSTIVSVQFMRLALYVVLTSAVFYFTVGPDGFLLPDRFILGLLAVATAFALVLLTELWPRLVKTKASAAVMYIVDIACVVAIIFVLSGAGSKLTFLLLVPLMMAGLLLDNRKNLRLVLLVSIVYSGSLLLLSNSIVDPVNYSLNQLSFFVVYGFTTAFRSQKEKLQDSLEIADQEIGSLKNLNELIVGNIAYGILTTSPHGKIIYHNAIAEYLLKTEDLLGKPIRFVHHQLGETIERTRITKKISGEMQIANERGDKQTILYTVSPMLEKAVGHRGYLFVLEDVTQIRQMEYQLRQREKLAAVGQLAAGIAHEIRNPLASISGSIQMLIADGKTEEETKLGRIVLREIDRLNNLIAEFLDFAKPPQVGTDALDLNGIVKEVNDLLKLNRHVNHGVDCQLILEAKQLVVGDKNKYKQGLLNIIINGYQAMAKSEVKILKIHSYDEAEKVILEISDTGSGIPEHELSKIFDAFHTTKVGGTGLGLAITHKIFEAHRVEVQVTSAVGLGTKFRLSFPALPIDLNEKKLRGIA